MRGEKIRVGDDFVIEEENIYCKDFREEMLENDEINSWEEAFMRGYDEAEQML